MADVSAIEWTDATWTPIRARRRVDGKVFIGWHCEHVSPGCENCYAETGFNKRMGTKLDFKPGHRKDVEIFLDEDMLLAPLKWKKARRIFVCSMTDLFGEFVRDEWIDRMFAVMALCPQHRFQVLTKRSARMRAYMAHVEREALWMNAVADALEAVPALTKVCHPILARREPWLPLPNVWLGVSAEDQERADERIPELLATPAAVRFVSLEPLLGPIDLTDLNGGNGLRFNVLGLGRKGLDWVIVGGESGPRARPMHPQWARDIRDQCHCAGVAYFFKQWGEWQPGAATRNSVPNIALDARGEAAGHIRSLSEMQRPAGMSRVGKRAAGRLLDGVEHNAMPGATT